MKIKPLGNRIVIKIDDVPSEIITKGGIIVPDFNEVKKQNTQTGIVKAVGPGTRTKDGNYNPSVVKVGDWVVFNHHGLFKCEINQSDGLETFLYISENDIVAILEK
jgi:chaperonin GroES